MNAAKVSGKKENGKREENGVRTSPNPGDAPVISPLTVDDMMNIAAARRPTTRTDDVSLIVHVDDTQSELDAELEASVVESKPSAATDAKDEKKPESSKSKRSGSESKKSSKDGKDSKSGHGKDTKASSSKKPSEKSSEKRFVG